MTKEILIQYCDLKREISKLENRIDKIEKQSNMIADVVQNGYKRHAVIFGFDFKRSDKLKQLKETLASRESMIIEQIAEIEKYINDIQDSSVRQIFEHRYIDNMNWYQIQTEMGYRHEDTARKKHDKFIEENL